MRDNAPYGSSCTVFGMSFSPWTYRARWALKLRGVSHRFKTYTPMIDEPRLRLVTKNFSGSLSVPVLLHGDLALTDSLDIVRYADRIGTRGTPLFPEGADGHVHRIWWLAREVMMAGRVRSLHRALRDRDALAGYLPFQAPPWLGRRLSFMSELGVRYILRK